MEVERILDIYKTEMKEKIIYNILLLDIDTIPTKDLIDKMLEPIQHFATKCENLDIVDRSKVNRIILENINQIVN